MAGEREEQIETGAASEATPAAGSLRRPLLIAAVAATGAGALFGTKALLDSRKNRGAGENESEEDLPTVLRHAALDVAIAATGEAADRLARGQSESQDKKPAAQRS